LKATVRLFRTFDELDRFVVAVTTAQRDAMAATVAAASIFTDDRQRLLFCRFSGRLFAAHCDTATRQLSNARDLALIDADIAALFPQIVELVESDLVVDLESLARFAVQTREGS